MCILNPQFTGIFTASGNSKTPFIVNTIGLIVNIVLDPILIFGIGKVSPLGVKGANISYSIITIVGYYYIYICIYKKMGIILICIIRNLLI